VILNRETEREAKSLFVDISISARAGSQHGDPKGSQGISGRPEHRAEEGVGVRSPLGGRSTAPVLDLGKHLVRFYSVTVEVVNQVVEAWLLDGGEVTADQTDQGHSTGQGVSASQA